jgi:hypothetical protein
MDDSNASDESAASDAIDEVTIWQRIEMVETPEALAQFISDMAGISEREPEWWINIGVDGYIDGLLGVVLATMDRAPADGFQSVVWQYAAIALMTATDHSESSPLAHEISSDHHKFVADAGDVHSGESLAHFLGKLLEALRQQPRWRTNMEIATFLHSLSQTVLMSTPQSLVDRFKPEVWHYWAVVLYRATSYE